MERTYTRREFGAYTLGMGLAGGAMASLSSPAEAAETDYETDAAGVPRPADADELRSALADASEHSLVECRSGTFRPGATLTIPDYVRLDATGVTFVPRHDDAVFSLGARGRLLNGTIQLGSSGGTGVLNDSSVGDSYAHKWGAVPVGTRITAESGSGATGYQVLRATDGGNSFYHNPVFATDGVDTPLYLDNPSENGFITSVNTRLVARDFVNAVVAESPNGISNNYTVCDLTPGSNTESVTVTDADYGRRNCAEGTFGDASKYDQIVWIQSTRQFDSDSYGGNHVHLSYDGYSSRRNPGLVRDDTPANDTYVVDFSQ